MKIERQLAEYILARIASGEYPVGTKIPSLRRLAGKFAMPYTTVQMQITHLVRSGLLSTVPGKGVYVAKAEIFSPMPASRRIAAFINPAIIGETTSISYLALLEFQRLALADRFCLEIHPVFYTDLTPQRFARESAGCCGAALFQEYDNGLDRLENELPVVSTLMDYSFGGRISLVNIDEHQVAELAADYFQSRGVTRVTVICSVPQIYHRRAAAFSSLWRNLGFDCSIHRDGPTARRLEPDTGYLFTSDTALHRYDLKYAELTGRTLNRDFIVLGIDGKRRLNPDWPLFPTVAVDWREIGAVMYAEFKRRIEQPQSAGRRIALAGELILVIDRAEQAAGRHYATARPAFYGGRETFNFDLVVNVLKQSLTERSTS